MFVFPYDYQVVVLQDHVVWLRLLAEPQQPHHVGVAELGEHLGLAAEVELKLLVSGLQGLHQDHRLHLALLHPLRLGQQHLAELPLTWSHKKKNHFLFRWSPLKPASSAGAVLPKVVMVWRLARGKLSLSLALLWRFSVVATEPMLVSATSSWISAVVWPFCWTVSPERNRR